MCPPYQLRREDTAAPPAWAHSAEECRLAVMVAVLVVTVVIMVALAAAAAAAVAIVVVAVVVVAKTAASATALLANRNYQLRANKTRALAACPLQPESF